MEGRVNLYDAGVFGGVLKIVACFEGLLLRVWMFQNP